MSEYKFLFMIVAISCICIIFLIIGLFPARQHIKGWIEGILKIKERNVELYRKWVREIFFAGEYDSREFRQLLLIVVEHGMRGVSWVQDWWSYESAVNYVEVKTRAFHIENPRHQNKGARFIVGYPKNKMKDAGIYFINIQPIAEDEECPTGKIQWVRP